MSVIRFVLGLLSGSIGLLILVPLIILILPFWLVASLTIWLARVIEPTPKLWGHLIEYDPLVGWKSRARQDGYHLADDVFQFSTDEQGWRDANRSIQESDLIVFGDSFAWSYGASDAQAFVNRSRNLKIKGIGTVGYTMVQEFLWMERLAPQLRGKLVVWFIFLGNDLYENLVPDMVGYRMPFLRQTARERWEIERNHIAKVRWPGTVLPDTDSRDYYAFLAELCGPSFLSRRAYSACHFLLRQARELFDHSETRLAVCTIPEPSQLTTSGQAFLRRKRSHPETLDPDYPDQEVSRICEELRIPILPLKQHLDESHYKSGDCHWNKNGHERVAQLLEQLYRDVQQGSSNSRQLQSPVRKQKIS